MTALSRALMLVAMFVTAAHCCPPNVSCFTNSDCRMNSETCFVCNMTSDNSPNGGFCIITEEYCNTPCSTNYDCAPNNRTGQCSECVRYNQTLGWGRCRLPPNNCGAACSNSYDCDNECDTCINGACAKSRPNKCGATCTGSDDCPGLESECIACVGGKCIKPTCGSPCNSFVDCGLNSDPCTYCFEGHCRLPSNASLKCGQTCGEGQGHCEGSCSVCVGYCYDPNSPPACGTPCNHGYPCPDSGECDYCSPDACTTFASAKAAGRVWDEHKHLDEAPAGSRLPPKRR